MPTQWFTLYLNVWGSFQSIFAHFWSHFGCVCAYIRNIFHVSRPIPPLCIYIRNIFHVSRPILPQCVYQEHISYMKTDSNMWTAHCRLTYRQPLIELFNNLQAIVIHTNRRRMLEHWFCHLYFPYRRVAGSEKLSSRDAWLASRDARVSSHDARASSRDALTLRVL